MHIDTLFRLFPEVVTDGKVDFDVLRELLGDDVDDSAERFGFSWNGKSQARRLAQLPSTATLRPCLDESLDWDTTRNLFIEGENLEVLKLLQKSYHRQVNLIYIDPPYNTGNEFIYSDKYQEHRETYLRASDQVDAAGLRLSASPETAGRYHTNWLNMMYPRLKLARNLLRDDGVIFISIDDNECHHLRVLCNEVFGEENFKADIAWQKRYTRSNNTTDFTTVVEHILVFSRSEAFAVNLLPRTGEADARYANPDKDDRGPWKGASFLNPATPGQRPNLCYEIRNPNTNEITRPTTNAWRRSKAEFDRLMREDRLYWGVDGRQPIPSVKMFLSDARGLTPTNFWSHEYAGCTDDGTRDMKQLFEGKLFDNPKPVLLMKRILEHASDADALVLDFFAGSCTLPQAVLEMNLADGGNRRFIAVQIPEPCASSSAAFKSGYATIADIGRERIRRAASQLRSELGAETVDLGFRALSLGTGSMTPWNAQPECLESSLNHSVDSIKTDRSEIDLLFELLLRSGLDLSVAIQRRTDPGPEMFVVDGGALIVCLENRVTTKTADEIVLVRKQLRSANTRVVFKDSGFPDDVTKANVIQMIVRAGIEEVTSL